MIVGLGPTGSFAGPKRRGKKKEKKKERNETNGSSREMKFFKKRKLIDLTFIMIYNKE